MAKPRERRRGGLAPWSVTEPDETVREEVARLVYHPFEGTIVAVNADGSFDVEDEFEQLFDSVPADNVRRACRICDAPLASPICANCGERDEG